jgi:hypothetical protein
MTLDRRQRKKEKIVQKLHLWPYLLISEPTSTRKGRIKKPGILFARVEVAFVRKKKKNTTHSSSGISVP